MNPFAVTYHHTNKMTTATTLCLTYYRKTPSYKQINSNILHLGVTQFNNSFANIIWIHGEGKENYKLLSLNMQKKMCKKQTF